RSASGVLWPDIQMHFLPAAVRYDGKVAAPGDGFQLHLGPMQSQSRGTVRLRAADAAVPPRIDFNYMSDPDDWRVFRAAVRLGRELFAQAPFDPYRGEELAPGPSADGDDAIDDFVRAHAESAYHPCGTCRMGTDPEAVVDPEGCVHGVPKLRVVDASIFPHITNGNLNAPTIMAAEKIAATITNRRLSQDPLPYYLDPEAPRRQRAP
ncbi:MAG: GMC oxidoreductase, partial [Pseudomonadota bacterium]